MTLARIPLLFVFFFLCFGSIKVSATGVSGVGCNLGNRIYINKLGTTNFWGTSFDVYDSNGTSYPIDWNNTSQCNSVNTSAASSTGQACWVNSYVNPPNNNSGSSHGTKFTYATTVCNVPFDTDTWVLIVLSGGFGGYFILRRELLSI